LALGRVAGFARVRSTALVPDPGLPVVGALLVIVARVFLPGDGGHSPLEGLKAGETPLANVPGVVLAAVGSLGFGAVLGPEMPVVALGSAVGVLVNGVVKLGPRERQVIANAGSFSAISALFGGRSSPGCCS
jgi:H+/Cl- antiporter ClcA